MPLAVHNSSWEIFDMIANMILLTLVSYANPLRVFYFFKELVILYTNNKYYKNIKEVLLLMSGFYERKFTVKIQSGPSR